MKVNRDGIVRVLGQQRFHRSPQGRVLHRRRQFFHDAVLVLDVQRVEKINQQARMLFQEPVPDQAIRRQVQRRSAQATQ